MQLIFGVTYILLALTVWTMLAGRGDSGPVRLWTLGAVLLGAGALVTAAGGPAGLGLGAIAVVSFLLRIQALRMHMGVQPRWLSAAAFLLVYGLGMIICVQIADPRFRLSFSNAMSAACAGAFAWHAVLAGRSIRSRSAALVAASEGLLCAAVMVRVVAVWFDPGRGAQANLPWDYVLVMVAAAIASIYGNLGYLGLVLDQSRSNESRAIEARAEEAASRRAAESSAAELRVLLAQRDQLVLQRQGMLELLAYQIRQPLHNAGGALSATASALRGMTGQDALQATDRLQRARAVLGTVNTVLDNTLAVANQLGSHVLSQLQEVDLALQIELALGDLDGSQRGRVQVQWLSDIRSAELETGLIRLALRNLLLNALNHGGATASVVLQVSESEIPPELILSVMDNGPRMSAQDRNQAEVERGDDPIPVTNLGLYIAAGVARRHGGRLELLNIRPRGLKASLILPLPG